MIRAQNLNRQFGDFVVVDVPLSAQEAVPAPAPAPRSPVMPTGDHQQSDPDSNRRTDAKGRPGILTDKVARAFPHTGGGFERVAELRAYSLNGRVELCSQVIDDLPARITHGSQQILGTGQKGTQLNFRCPLRLSVCLFHGP